uniref:Protein-tyrosine phosphatase n=1 Tax=Haemonchus contortus TaxID=6289 RepID=A0A7I4Z135_HAECO
SFLCSSTRTGRHRHSSFQCPLCSSTNINSRIFLEMMEPEPRAKPRRQRSISVFAEGIRENVDRAFRPRRRKSCSRSTIETSSPVTDPDSAETQRPRRQRKNVLHSMIQFLDKGHTHEFDVSSAFLRVSEVDLRKYEPVWSFLPPILDKEVKAARREQIKDFVENALRNGPKGLVAEFKKIPMYEDFTKMNEFLHQNNRKRNRYRDIGCFDESRVKLTLGTNSYIHANYVSSPNNPRRFICTQGPLPQTCADFWYMVIQEDVDVIVMLCNFIEAGHIKCAKYYPLNTNESMMFEGGIIISLKCKERLKFPFETNAIVEVTTLDVSLPDFPLRSCTHYHWVDWPDQGVPQADMAPLYLLYVLEQIRTPIIIHCSAGIGRSGSMVLLQYAMDVLGRGDVLRMMNIYLEKVRTQRCSSVQNIQQYLFVHVVLLNFFQKTGCLPRSLEPALESFRKSYRRIVREF